MFHLLLPYYHRGDTLLNFDSIVDLDTYHHFLVCHWYFHVCDTKYMSYYELTYYLLYSLHVGLLVFALLKTHLLKLYCLKPFFQLPQMEALQMHF